MKKRICVVQGGTSAGKTYGIIPVLIDYAIRNPRKLITIAAETIPAVRAGALKIFTDVMVDTNRWIEGSYKGNPMHYKFGNGSVIEFKSFDTIGKAKAAGKRDVLFINECNHVAYNIADALIIRTTEKIYLDYNPDNVFWVQTEVLKQPNAEFLLLKYTDNEALAPEILEDLKIKQAKAYYDVSIGSSSKENIKSEYWANWCRVYIDGLVGSLQGTIYQFNIVQQIPPQAELLAYGLDWGFTNDPTAMIAMYRLNKELYIKELLYKKEMKAIDISNAMDALGVDRYKTIYADDSEPRTIAEVQALGWHNLTGANKGNIKPRIDLMQSHSLNFDANSLNLIKEGRNYKWAENKSGEAVNTPIGAYNHLMDAMGYAGINKLRAGVGVYSFS